jgi:GNAT superfamily N-acetyltransferase
MLIFEDITIHSWGKVATSVMKSELAYKKSIRTSRIEYANILMDGDAIGKIAFNDSDYVGNIIGYPPTKAELKDYKLNKPEHKCIKYMYIFNFVVANHYRGEGFGSKILREFLIKAKEQGYERIIGHFRPNGSLALIKKFGAVELELYENWENTKEDYVFCELDLKKIELINPVITIKH